MTITRADSESLAKSIAHETIADLEKEKTMKGNKPKLLLCFTHTFTTYYTIHNIFLELEIKDITARQKTDITNKDIALHSVSFFTHHQLVLLLSFLN